MEPQGNVLPERSYELGREARELLGAPDPGPRPPDDFVGEDCKAANPEWTQRWYRS
jgi:hypothetical protein